MEQCNFSDSESSGMGGSFASEFEKLVDRQLDNLRPGKIVSGTVVSINKDMVTVDIGFKSDGVVPKEQFSDAEGKLLIALGDRVDVCVLALEGDTGQVLLSKERLISSKFGIT